MSDWKHKKDQCFIETHFAEVFNEQQCGREVTYFEDFTDNHNKALIQIDIENAQCNMVTAIIETRDGRKIERPIPLFEGEGERAFQVEDVCRVALRGENSPVWHGAQAPAEYPPSPQTFEADVNVTKTFCICCPNDNHGKHENHSCDRCGSSNRCGCSRNSYGYNYY